MKGESHMGEIMYFNSESLYSHKKMFASFILTRNHTTECW